MPERREFRIGGTVAVLLLVASYLFATNRGQEALLRAKLDAERLVRERDSIAGVGEATCYHVRVVLRPRSGGFEPIEVPAEYGMEVALVAESVGVLCAEAG
jgi:hypothetical protein